MPSINDTSAMQFHLFIFSLLVFTPGVYSYSTTCDRGQGVSSISAISYGSKYTTSLQNVYAASESVPYMPYEDTHINCAIQCARSSRPWFWTNGQSTNVDCHCIRVTWLVHPNTNTPTSEFGQWSFLDDYSCNAGSSGCTQKFFYQITFNCINCPSGGYYQSPHFGSGGGSSFYYPAMSNGPHSSGMLGSYYGLSYTHDTQSEFETTAVNNNYFCYHCANSNLYANNRLGCHAFSDDWKTTCAPSLGLTYTNEVYMSGRSKDSDGTCTAKNVCPNGYVNEGSGFEYNGDYSNYVCVGCPKGYALTHSNNVDARTSTYSQCNLCAWGKYTSSIGQATCTNWQSCYNGQYLEHPDYDYYYSQGVCSNCIAGKYRDTGYSNDPTVVHGSDKCQWCSHGTYTASTGTTTCSNWINCGDGQYITGGGPTTYGSCASCAAGTYKAGSSTTVTSCTSCPSYTYSTGGASACSDWISCGDGQRISGASSTSYGSCANCPTGQYKAGTSNQITSCSTCPAQTFALGGATACTPWTECPAGSFNIYNSRHQDSICGLCGAGKFTASANRLTSCETCPSGTFTTAQGTTACLTWTVTTCPAGQEVLDGTASTDSYCNDCVAGKAKAGTNGDACSPCEAGSFSTGGAATCTPWKTCSKGESYTAGSATADATCIPCEAGTFQANDGSTATCSPCEAGTFSAEGADACTPWKTCDAGEFYTAGSATADATCTPCPASEYQPDSSSTATSCLPCSTTDEYSTGGAATCTSTLASCDKGYRFVDGSAVAPNQCIACDPGYAQPDDSTRVIQCTPCPAGEFQDQSAADSCEICPTGTYASSGATTQCSQKTICEAPAYYIGIEGGLIADDDCACSSGFEVSTDSNGLYYCKRCEAGLVNEAGDFPSANTLTTCDTCDIANSEANEQNSSCVCKDGHSLGEIVPATYYEQTSGLPSNVITETECENAQVENAVYERADSLAHFPSGCVVSGQWIYYNTLNTEVSCTETRSCYVINTPEVPAPCSACAAGTYRVGGDSVDGNATTCEACPAEHFSLEGSKECTAWTTCAAGLYLASPSATQDGTCIPCTAGSFQPDSDSIAQSCTACDYNTHSAEGASSCTPWTECTGDTHYNGNRITGDEHCDANYVCSLNSTEHTAPTSTSDRICACDAGHSLGESYKLVTVGEGSSHSIVTAAECENSGYTWQGSVSLSSYPSGCVIVDGVSAYYNTQTTQVTCGSGVEDGSIILSEEDILPEPITQAECSSHATTNGYNFAGTTDSTILPRGCIRAGGGTNVYYNTQSTSTRRCNEVISSHGFAGCFVKEQKSSTCYVSDGLKCQPCPAGTARLAGDLSNNGTTTCAPCAAGSFTDEAAAATCTPYTDADCDKGFELVTSAGNAPVLTEDASCSACVEGKWQPLDSTLNLCQPHTDLGCDASTEVGDGTTSVDSAQCVCKGGHHLEVTPPVKISSDNSYCPSTAIYDQATYNGEVDQLLCAAECSQRGEAYSMSRIYSLTGDFMCYCACDTCCNTIHTGDEWHAVYELTPPVCEACLAGTYRAKGDLVSGPSTTCDACPAKTYSTGTAAECTGWTPCAAGSYNTIDSATQDSTCGVCSANSYTGTSNTLTACLAHKTQCPTGEQLKAGTGNTTHDKECEECPEGTFQASASGAPCATWRTTCDKGTQLESDGSASQDRSCSTCVAGKFQPLDATANACGDYRTSCPPGFALQDDGTTETDRTCQTCPEGTFKDDHGDHSCSLFRTTCPAGTQLVRNGNTEKDHDCQPCPKATFQGTESNETCALCEKGKEVTPLNALEGATGCVACVQATHIDSDGVSHTACELLSGDKCPAGMGYLITDATKPNLCLPCPAGEFQASDDSDEACVAHTITTCPAGKQLKAGTASTDSECVACPSGTYKSGSGADACTPWLYEVCEVGFERTSAPSATQDGTCSACASGYFNNGKNADACKEHREVCPAGFGLVAGTTEADATCQSCVSGFSANLDGGACVAHRTSCAAGEALGTDGDASNDHSCTPCVSGTYNTDGITCIPHSEASCPSGQGFTGSSTVDGSCQSCVDSYQPNAGSTAACKAWTVCDPSTEIETQAPSAVQDRICACAEGHRYDKPSASCIACGGNLKRAAGDVKFVASSLI